MKRSLPIVRILSSALLISCGGGGASVVAPPPPPPPPKANAPQVQLSSANSTAIEGDTIQLVWSSTDATTCEAFGSWSGSLSLTGQSKIKLATYGHPAFGLRCTGAGGTTETSVTVVSRVAVRNLSYSNFKEVGVLPSTVPYIGAARAYGDFFEDGSLSLITFKFTTPSSIPFADQMPGVLEFWTQNAAGTWIKKTPTLTVEAPFCLAARRAVVADFNGDRKPDVVFACTGWDQTPFPGERDIIVLSQPDGGYVQRFVNSDVAYHHSVTACDLNGDGNLDLVFVIANGVGRLRVEFGDGHGNFTFAPSHPLSSVTGRLFEVECLDINGDGVLDVITGGKEWLANGGITIFYGAAGGAFTSQVIPPVANFGMVNDFTVTGTGSARTLWVNRQLEDNAGNNGRLVQRVNLATLQSTVVLQDASQIAWIRWLIPYNRAGVDYIGSDNKADLVELLRVP